MPQVEKQSDYIIQEIPIVNLIRDEAQCRIEFDETAVDEYAEREREGSEIPPIDVIPDGSGAYIQFDGEHRTRAREKNGHSTILARVHNGNINEARKLGLEANISHGVRFTGVDKRNKAEIAVRHPELKLLEHRELGRRIGVSEGLIRKVRKELEQAAYGTHPHQASTTVEATSDNSINDDRTELEQRESQEVATPATTSSSMPLIANAKAIFDRESVADTDSIPAKTIDNAEDEDEDDETWGRRLEQERILREQKTRREDDSYLAKFQSYSSEEDFLIAYKQSAEEYKEMVEIGRRVTFTDEVVKNVFRSTNEVGKLYINGDHNFRWAIDRSDIISFLAGRGTPQTEHEIGDVVRRHEIQNRLNELISEGRITVIGNRTGKGSKKNPAKYTIAKEDVRDDETSSQETQAAIPLQHTIRDASEKLRENDYDKANAGGTHDCEASSDA